MRRVLKEAIFVKERVLCVDDDSAGAVRMEMERLAAEARDYIIAVNGRRMMIACLLSFELVAATQFQGFVEMLAAFGASLTGGSRRDRQEDGARAHG